MIIRVRNMEFRRFLHEMNPFAAAQKGSRGFYGAILATALLAATAGSYGGLAEAKKGYYVNATMGGVGASIGIALAGFTFYSAYVNKRRVWS